MNQEISDFATAVQNMNDEAVAQNQRIIELATGLNYWGKRLDTSKSAVIVQIADQVVGKQDDDTEYSVDTLNWIRNVLENGKPVKPAAAKKKVAAEDTRPVSAGAMTHTEQQREVKPGKRFLVTSAQNNTAVHTKFLEALKFYAAEIGAELVVFPFLYNKKGFQNGEGADDIWYAPELKPYLRDDHVWLGEGRKVAALALNILPTAKYPLSGLKEAVGSAEALIVPHASISHECLPVLGAQYGAVVPMLYSTGTVTQRNYIQQAAGQKAENRHNFGALIVEFNEHGQWWIRQIETDETGEFYDLRNSVLVDNNGEWFKSDDSIAVINYGDIHAEKLDFSVAFTQWSYDNPNSMLDYLRPKYQMCHDLLDFAALNHHNRGNHYHLAKNQVNARTVEMDMYDVNNVLRNMQRDWCNTIVVRSNHDDALDRWLADPKYEPRNDPANALVYYGLQVAAYTELKEGHDVPDMLPEALFKVTGELPPAKFLRASESFKVGGVELGEHGHSGINGSRGSPKQFASTRCTTGHTHTPSIYGGCYTAGVSGKLAMGYNEEGASSWAHACVIQYNNGKRAILHVKDNGAGKLDYKATE